MWEDAAEKKISAPIFDVILPSNTGDGIMVEKQHKLVFSSYMEIYELVVPKVNLL